MLRRSAFQLDEWQIDWSDLQLSVKVVSDEQSIVNLFNCSREIQSI